MEEKAVHPFLETRRMTPELLYGSPRPELIGAEQWRYALLGTAIVALAMMLLQITQSFYLILILSALIGGLGGLYISLPQGRVPRVYLWLQTLGYRWARALNPQALSYTFRDAYHLDEEAAEQESRRGDGFTSSF